MLVDMGLDAGGDDGAEFRLLSRDNAGRERNAGGLDLHADRAVLIEVPEEAVDIVADGRDRRDNQPAGSHGAHLAGPRVRMLPEQAEILLVHADRVLYLARFAPPVVGADVEIVDMAQAIATELEGIEHGANAVFAGIERIAPEIAAGRIAIGHDHFGHGRAVHDGPQTAFVLVADPVQHQPFAQVVSDADMPVLPLHAITVDLEAGAFGLRDFERPDIGAQVFRRADGG